MKKAIVFSVSNLYSRQLGVSIINLQKTNPDLYDNIVVVEYNLSDEDKKFLKKIEPKVIFVKYTPEDFCKDFNITPSDNIHPIYHKEHACVQLGKHVIFRLLKDFDKILLLEVDMIINGDISELFVKPGCGFVNYYNFDDYAKYPKLCVDYSSIGFDKNLTKNMYATNGGLFYVDRTIDYKKALSLSLDLKKKYIFSTKESKSHNNPGGIDELCLSYVIHYLTSNVRYFNYRVYNSLINKYGMRDNVLIVHAFYNYKPWTNYQVFEYFPLWKESYLKWLELGGKPIENLHVEKGILSLVNNLNNETIIYILSEILHKYSSILSLAKSFDSDIFSRPFSEQIKLKSSLKFKFNYGFITIEFKKSVMNLVIDLPKEGNSLHEKYMNDFLSVYSSLFSCERTDSKLTITSISFKTKEQICDCIDIVVNNLCFLNSSKYNQLESIRQSDTLDFH